MKRSIEPTDNTPNKRVRRIDARSKEGKEASEKLFLEVTTKGTRILPTNKLKYAGSIRKSNKSSWRVSFRIDKRRESKSFRDKEEAIQYKLDVNIREGLVKNIIYVLDGQYYCILTQNQVMKFSAEDMNMVEDHIWCAVYDPGTRSFYVFARLSDIRPITIKGFHQLMLPVDNDDIRTPDHINRDTLDNNRDNVRLVTQGIQTINQDIRLNNTSGFTGVHHLMSSKWIATWRDENGVPRMKSFCVATYGDDAKIMAKAHRKEMVIIVDKKLSDLGKPSFKGKTMSNNPSNTQGVRFRTVDEWIASYVDGDGKKHQKRFPVSKHNDACELAVAYRTKMEKSIEKYNFALLHNVQ